MSESRCLLSIYTILWLVRLSLFLLHCYYRFGNRNLATRSYEHDEETRHIGIRPTRPMYKSFMLKRFGRAVSDSRSFSAPPIQQHYETVCRRVILLTSNLSLLSTFKRQLETHLFNRSFHHRPQPLCRISSAIHRTHQREHTTRHQLADIDLHALLL